MVIYKELNHDIELHIATKRDINNIIKGLDIRTFDYMNFKYEYSRFTSKKELIKPDYMDFHDNLCFFLFSENEIRDVKARRNAALHYGIREFCIALELRNMCGCVDARDDSLFYYEESHTKRFLKFADLFYHEEFINYSNSYLARFEESWIKFRDLYTYSYKLNPALDSLLVYIRDCFFYNRTPSYDDYLKYSLSFKFQTHDNDIVISNFEELINNTSI